LLRYVRFKATTTINQFHPKDTLMVISLVVRIDTPKDFPSMHLNATNIRINEDIFPDFSAELVSKDSILSINNLELKGLGVFFRRTCVFICS
jgi:hypothetical protein